MEESVNVLKFAEARASEISSMMDDINYKKNKTAFQRLPPHMRRRAASHNPKRVPRKLRESFLVQNPHATTKTKKIHQRQRKKNHKKQKTNFPQEFASRIHGGMWLETNVWHSKRFKMEKKFGYKLPINANDKKLGATHKAVTEAAMLMDLSYYCCIALEGPEKQLCERLFCLTNKTAVSHFESEKYRDGKFEGHAFLYYPNSFPYEAIGPVTFMWRPIDVFNDSVDLADSKEIVRKLWIWCHPSFYDELVKVLINIFNLNESTTYNSNTADVTTDGENNVEKPEREEDKGEIIKDNTCQTVFASKVNFEKVKVKFQKKKVYTAGEIKMSLLKDKLNRFRVIGPNAYSILSNVLDLGNVDGLASQEKTTPKFNVKVPNDDLNESPSSPILLSATCKTDTKEHKRKLHSIADNDICYSTSKKLKLNSESVKFDECKLNKSNSVSTKLAINGTYNNENKSNLEFTSIEETSKMATSNFSSSDRKLWWQSYYANDSRKLSHSKRQNLIDCLQSRFLNYYIPPGSIFGLTVRDPRLVSYHKQKKFIPEIDSSNLSGKFDEIFTSEMASSPLWDEDICNEVTMTQISEDEINKERAKYVVSSVSLNFGNRESRIPILLIHQKGTDGFATGFDIIAPLGWGMAFWIPLVLNGGRAAGLRDLNFVNLETGQPSFPLSCPDTKAGMMFEEECRVEELSAYYKRPKAKRPNFSTFGTPNPFYMPWEVLIKDWKNEVEDLGCEILFLNIISKMPDVSYENFSPKIDGKDSFFVLRQKEIQELLNLFTLLNQVPKKNSVEAHKRLESLKQDYNSFIVSTIGTHKQFVNSYALVKVQCKGRGCPTKHSGIYMPSDCDITEIRKAPNFLGPVEPNHNANKNVNKMDKLISLVTNEESIAKDTTKSNELCKEELNNDNFSKNDEINARNLKRPEVLNLKTCCSRKLVGYLSEGGFSSISGKGCGIGHCSFIGLLIMLKSCINSQIAPHVLIREQHSFQYRVCSIEIIKNYL